MSTRSAVWPRDRQLMYVMHRAFRRDLDGFCGAVRRTPVTERCTWKRLADRWDLFAGILHVHHTAEHAELDPLLDACSAGFRRLAQRPDADTRAALTVRVCAAKESLKRHLDDVETGAIDCTPDFAARLVPWASYGVPREALDRVFADVGRGSRVLWLLTRGRFARREGRAFAHA